MEGANETFDDFTLENIAFFWQVEDNDVNYYQNLDLISHEILYLKMTFFSIASTYIYQHLRSGRI